MLVVLYMKHNSYSALQFNLSKSCYKHITFLILLLDTRLVSFPLKYCCKFQKPAIYKVKYVVLISENVLVQVLLKIY